MSCFFASVFWPGKQEQHSPTSRLKMNLPEHLKPTEQRCDVNTRYRRCDGPLSAAPTLPQQRGLRSDPRAAPRLPPPAVPGRGRRVRTAQDAPRPHTPLPTPSPEGGGSRLTDPGGHIDEVEAGGREGEKEDEGEHGAIGDPQHLPKQWHPPSAPAAGRSAQSRRAAAGLPRGRRPVPPMDRAERR